MKPIIGMTTSVSSENKTFVSQDYLDCIANNGGVPVLLPNQPIEKNIDLYASWIDGLLVTGGDDIDPTLFGEEPHRYLGEIVPERDHFEKRLLEKLLQIDKPIFALCRGCQILNIAANGDMFQDIYAQLDKELLQHQQKAPRSHLSHFVHVKEGSLLSRITGNSRFKVNSFHHQAVRNVADGFVASAYSSDGIIEAIESNNHRFVLGVQWHPECLVKRGDEVSKKLFQSFVEACERDTEEISMK